MNNMYLRLHQKIIRRVVDTKGQYKADHVMILNFDTMYACKNQL